MTQLTTEQIRELNEKRTQGDWCYDNNDYGTVYPTEGARDGIVSGYGHYRTRTEKHNNANFIAAAPQIATQYLELAEKYDKAVRGLAKIMGLEGAYYSQDVAKQTLEELGE